MEYQQEEMKRGLMRGVCALNMEAMAVFRKSGHESLVNNMELNRMKLPADSNQIFAADSKGNVSEAKEPQPKLSSKPSKVLITRHQ